MIDICVVSVKMGGLGMPDINNTLQAKRVIFAKKGVFLCLKKDMSI